MTNTEIKKECKALYKSNRENQKRLKEIRDGCKHEKTFLGDYSYGIGRTSPAIICEYCNSVVRWSHGEVISK